MFLALSFNYCQLSTELFSMSIIMKLKTCKFYIRGSVYRNSRLKKSNKMQLYADIYLLLNYCTCFGLPSRLSSGVHKTVVAVSGTDHTIWEACSPNSMIYAPDHTIWETCSPNSMICAPQIVWSVPEVATTVLCTPDDGRDGRPKYVE